MVDMPQYVLKQKRLSKTKTVVIFRRNYLDIKNFMHTEEGWVFEENFTHFGTKGYFKMMIHSDDIFSMYMVDTKTMKIKGKHNSFGIFMRMPQLNTPFKEEMTVGCVECILQCSGKKLGLDIGNGVGKPKKKKNYGNCHIHSGSRTPVEIPSTVRWSASHPFQGGGISPK